MYKHGQHEMISVTQGNSSCVSIIHKIAQTEIMKKLLNGNLAILKKKNFTFFDTFLY